MIPKQPNRPATWTEANAASPRICPACQNTGYARKTSGLTIPCPNTGHPFHSVRIQLTPRMAQEANLRARQRAEEAAKLATEAANPPTPINVVPLNRHERRRSGKTNR